MTQAHVSAIPKMGPDDHFDHNSSTMFNDVDINLTTPFFAPFHQAVSTARRRVVDIALLDASC